MMIENIITPDELSWSHVTDCTSKARRGIEPNTSDLEKSGDPIQSAQNFDNTVNDVGGGNFTF